MTEKEKKILDYYDKIQYLVTKKKTEINKSYYFDIGGFFKWLSGEYSQEQVRPAWEIFTEAYKYKLKDKYSQITLETKVNSIINYLMNITQVDYSIFVYHLIKGKEK